MCGRYLITTPLEAVGEWFNPASIASVPPHDNAAPTQNLGVLAYGPDKQLHVVAMQWGLVPAWAQDAKGSGRHINARSETVFEKPTFRDAAQARPCLIPANGFYEWQREDKAKQPYLISWSDQPLFFFLGVWDLWQKGEKPLWSFAILTRDANPSIASIHERMPLMVSAAQGKRWLEERHDPQRVLDQLSYQSAQVRYQARPVEKARINQVQGAKKPAKQGQLF